MRRYNGYPPLHSCIMTVHDPWVLMANCQSHRHRGTPSRQGTMIRMRLAAILVFATSSLADAQVSELPLSQWQHTKWTGQAGPPVPGSHSLLGSSDGYIWLAAMNSILRFDGVRFTIMDSTTTPA